MLNFTRKRNPLLLPSVLSMALALMFCEPGKSLDPTPAVVVTPEDTGKVAKIELVSAPGSVLPTDTATVSVSITDSATGGSIKAKLAITSTQFAILSASANKELALDSVPPDGNATFRIAGTTPGNGTVNVRVTSGNKIRNLSIPVIITEKPIAPKVKETLPKSVAAKETTLVAFTVVDSAQERPLANAVVTVTSANYTILNAKTADTASTDTTGTDGKVGFRVYTAMAAGAGTLQVKVKTAAGITRSASYTLPITEDSAQDRPRKMVFTALRSSLRADGTDSTELRVLVKDDNNNPLPNEKLSFTSTGGVVRAAATTDAWGVANTVLKSERVNKTVIVTATLEKTGATAQQSVSFDGVTINILPAKRVLMTDSIDPVLFELRDGGNVPISGDSMEIVARGAFKGFGLAGPDSMLVVTDTKGQYRTAITSTTAKSINIVARALGTKSEETVAFSNRILTLSSSKSSISGDGLDLVAITATLKDGDKVAMAGAELRWTTTFGSFTTAPINSTDGSGQASIVLKAPRGSGLAVVNVEALTKTGSNRDLVASGNVTISVKSLKVARMVLKVTPDNIPVKTGETKLIAMAYDSSNNYMAGVLVGFKMIKGAGGGDETITPPVDYTKAGQAEAVFRAGGVISLYRGVKLAAVALDISGTDTLVIASSDTIGLTVSGPPHRISVGVNILKGENPNDGTFSLPTAAVVTDVNGNLVADGTPVNFSTTPTAAFYFGESWKPINDWPYYVLGDTVWYRLPWSDYNSNKKLDADEEVSEFDPTRSRPYRGEDRDGNGVINLPPEVFDDINNNGVWDEDNAEPLIQGPADTSQRAPGFVDFNRNGIRDTTESFYDYNNDGKCQCAGQRDASGNLYEVTYFGSTANHPFPGEVSVGIPRSIVTNAGKATTKITYVQSMARHVEVRVTAESNGIQSFVDVWLPIVSDDK
ncbi:MAG TPA: Ig-like domain-containing protein [Fibrobacteria bacterium]|nr:Ig-like domain-containing protein [Fibrobacteria bacterium]